MRRRNDPGAVGPAVAKAQRLSTLVDVPHEQGRRDNDAAQVLSVGGFRQGLPGRNVGSRFEAALLYLSGDLLAGLAVARLEPFLS